MLNQLLKLGLFVTLGIWLKNRIRGLTILVVVLAAAWIAHNEYLAYLAHSGDTGYIGLSYVAKWGVFILGFGAYYFLVERDIAKDPATRSNVIEQAAGAAKQGDGFDFLREKKKLRSQAEITLEKSADSKR